VLLEDFALLSLALGLLLLSASLPVTLRCMPSSRPTRALSLLRVWPRLGYVLVLSLLVLSVSLRSQPRSWRPDALTLSASLSAHFITISASSCSLLALGILTLCSRAQGVDGCLSAVNRRRKSRWTRCTERRELRRGYSRSYTSCVGTSIGAMSPVKRPSRGARATEERYVMRQNPPKDWPSVAEGRRGPRARSLRRRRGRP
jgi:hypothetical protein